MIKQQEIRNENLSKFLLIIRNVATIDEFKADHSDKENIESDKKTTVNIKKNVKVQYFSQHLKWKLKIITWRIDEYLTQEAFCWLP